jgi:hypothetical protein
MRVKENSMPLPLLKWRAHRILTDRLGILKTFSNRKKSKRVLFLTVSGQIAQAQIFPFFLYQNAIAKQYGIELRELPLRQFLAGSNFHDSKIDAVLFQTWFDLRDDEIATLARRIKATWPDAAVAYMDWFAPTDLRFADPLCEHVSAYVKKQVLKDFGAYHTPTIGDTNLTDYYCRRFALQLPLTQFRIPNYLEQKLFIGSNFDLSPMIFRNFKPFQFSERSIDLHARIATQGTPWYGRMRQESLNAAENLQDRFSVACSGRISLTQYFKELRNSKMCFSPFGYGEICWRDFEAFLTGALLLKPDVSHLRLANDYFKPFETYVPISWDLSDFEEKVAYYASRPQERERIARNAFSAMHANMNAETFSRSTAALWNLLGLTA